MSSRHVRYIPANGITLAVHEWGTPGAPPIVCVPGTGLTSAFFAGVEERLASRWHGFSVDRRGHGLSEKPEADFDFHDLAGDISALVEELGLTGVTGLGHSSGATDMMLAAATHPDRWRMLVVFEPIIHDPRVPSTPDHGRVLWQDSYDKAIRRKRGFPSMEAAVARFSQSDDFGRAPEQVLRTYLRHAVEEQPDGSVILHSPPETIAKISGIITQLREKRWTPRDGLTDPFEYLLTFPVPTLYATCGQSGEMYMHSAAIAEQVIPIIFREHHPNAGHLLPMDHPEIAADTVERMAARFPR